MDTLYTLCRAVDNHHAAPLGAEAAAEIGAHKRAHFEREAASNPLVRAILGGAPIDYFGRETDDRTGFLQGPAGFFRTHEVLRHTRRGNRPVRIDGREYPHDEAVAMFERCVPNVKLRHQPWFSLARYPTTLGLAWGTTLLAAHLAAREAEDGRLLDPALLYYLGLTGTMAALVVSALKSNRDVRHASPWNSAAYLDLNASLLRRNSPLVAAARKEILPRQQLKTPEFYHALIRRIDTGGFDPELLRLLASTDSA